MSHSQFKSAVRSRRMTIPVVISTGKSQRGHSRLMMLLCIAVPVIALTILFTVGSSWFAWSTALFLLCPIVMGTMMFMMMRNHRVAANSDSVEQSISKDNPASAKSISSSNAFEA